MVLEELRLWRFPETPKLGGPGERKAREVGLAQESFGVGGGCVGGWAHLSGGSPRGLGAWRGAGGGRGVVVPGGVGRPRA